MNIQSIIILAAVIAVLVFAFVRVLRKKGSCGSCCGSCEECSRSCRKKEN
ncbi:MAG: FeoB-associated Cys-rich membrane protein [Oscillospiraceae bacterium]|nr:FeoB-associated Cys-rich membrane protein [Oscillospiraceae bacterium]